MDNNHVEIKNLCKYYPISEGILSRNAAMIKAVDGVNLNIKKGEALGLVGESGCGKTTLGKAAIFLVIPTSGEILFEGKSLGKLSKEELRNTRQKMQIVFQDPYSSLNARMSVGSMISEPLIAHNIYTKKEASERVNELLSMVGLRPFHSRRYPHEFSGGQRQRISIARMLSVNPNFVVCDEPVSALDVSVQSQVLNLLNKLKNDLKLTYLFISHDLSVVRHISDRIGVMYMGKIVELASETDLYKSKLHPYTKALFSAMPIPRMDTQKKRIILEGDLPSPINLPTGCSFHKRCSYSMPVCSEISPELIEVEKEHFCACHLHVKP